MMRIALFGACLLTILATGAAFAKDESPRFRIDNLEIVDLVGDPLITADSVRSLCDAMLELGSFVSYRGGEERRSEFDVEGAHRIANVFRVPEDHTGPTLPVEIVVEIENVYYGPKPEDVGDSIAEAWLFGPILSGAFADESDVVMGMVQYRATVRCPAYEEDVVTVGQGAVADPVSELSRRDSLEDSAQRATWDIMYAIVADVNEAWDLDIDAKFKSIEFDDYEEAVEKWWDER